MKTSEDEAFDELARKQDAWGGGYQAKREAALDKLVQEQERLGLYDPPPQREWVGLTEGEREEIVSGYTIGPGFELEAVGDVDSVARAVEDKLKEKNT